MHITTQADAVGFIRTAARDGGRWLLIGSPGVGITMLARRIARRVCMTDETRLAASVICHAAGLMREGSDDLLAGAPFRAPHHTCSTAALCGGGRPWRPGECSLAHGGTLFLDELPEFRRATLDCVREVIDAGTVRGVPSAPRVLVASASPCPCGYGGSPRCACTSERLRAWDARLGSLVAPLELATVRVTPWFDHATPVTLDAALEATP